MTKLSKDAFAASEPLPYRYSSHPVSVPCTLDEEPAEYMTMPKKKNLPLEEVKSVPSVLVVEDNKLNQRVMQMMLSNMGCQVVVAGNSRLAIEACQKQSFDLIFMDVGLPDTDGVRTTEIIRNELKLKNLPVLGVTAHIPASEINTLKTECFDDIHLKPITSDMFKKLLKRWVPNKQLKK